MPVVHGSRPRSVSLHEGVSTRRKLTPSCGQRCGVVFWCTETALLTSTWRIPKNSDCRKFLSHQAPSCSRSLWRKFSSGTPTDSVVIKYWTIRDDLCSRKTVVLNRPEMSNEVFHGSYLSIESPQWPGFQPPRILEKNNSLFVTKDFVDEHRRLAFTLSHQKNNSYIFI